MERFAPGYFQIERHRAAKFARGLRLNLHASISMFHGATLQEAIATILEDEATHMIHHARRALGQSMQSNHQRQWGRDED